MRPNLLFFLLLTTAYAAGQRIDFRNDSLFVNHYYVNKFTGKSTLDSLLNAKGKEKKKPGKYKSATKEKKEWITYTYKKAGLIFTKKEGLWVSEKYHDTTDLSVAIKLSRNSDATISQGNMPTQTFKGELYIDSNYMNDKRSIEKLQQLKNCSVVYKEATLISHTGIVSCDIIYQRRQIRTLFDFKTNLLTCVFIN